MGKKTLITIGIVLVAVVVALLFVHAVPFWVTLSCLVAFIAGGILGYIAGKRVLQKALKEAQAQIEKLLPVAATTTKVKSTKGKK